MNIQSKINRSRKLRGLVFAFGLSGHRTLSISALAMMIFAASAPAGATAVEQKKQIGEWSLYCAKTSEKLQFNDCSIVTAVVSKNDSKIWLKLGVAATSNYGDLKMIIKTPRIDYFKTGIVLKLDGRQLGQAFIEKCDATSCQAAIILNPKIGERLSSAQIVTFQYQTSDKDYFSLSVPLAGYSQALTELKKTIGVPRSIEQMQNRFIVAMKTNPYLTTDSTTNSTSFGVPLRECHGVPAVIGVTMVKGSQIENPKRFFGWLEKMKKCASNSVFWIAPNERQTDNINGLNVIYRANSYSLYSIMKSEVPEVVFTDIGGQLPIQPAIHR